MRPAVKGGIKCWAGRSTIFCLINFWQATVTWPLLSSMHFWMWCLKCLFSRHWLKRNQEYNDWESWDLHQCQSAGLPALIKNWSQCVCYAHQWSLLYKWHRATWSIYVKLLSVIEVSGRWKNLTMEKNAGWNHLRKKIYYTVRNMCCRSSKILIDLWIERLS